MKKIVLFSDGTGNSAAKRHRTNVWRLYQALDVHPDDQIAFYDDGVGSQEFRLFKVLGGAFGWGLKRTSSNSTRAFAAPTRRTMKTIGTRSICSASAGARSRSACWRA